MKFCFSKLINNKKEASMLIDLLNRKISKQNFKNTVVYENIKKFVALSSFKNTCDYLNDAKEFLQVLDIEDKKSLDSFLKDHKWIKSNIKNILFNYIKSILHRDLSLVETDRIYNPRADLIKLFVDHNFVKQVEKDKSFILNLKNEIKQVEIYLKNKNKSLQKFVRIGVGWFDEPYDHGDKKDLLELLDKSLEQCDRWIEEETSGKFLHGENSFHIDLSSGQSDSWNEWKHIFPNTLKWLDRQVDWQHE